MLDKLEMLLCLARERHFGRAAEAAGVTQPTLSSAVKTLEEQFGVLIVVRGSRFQGFTVEGERILVWARRLVADARSMRQEVRALGKGPAGRLRLGAVPTALPFVASLTDPLCARHEDLAVRVISMTADQVLLALEAYEVDAGLTYLKGALPPRLTGLPLYDERYSVLVARGGALDRPFRAESVMSWAEAGMLPLCLLTPDMRHRRIVDRHLAEAGTASAPRVETNSLTVLQTHVATGRFATILPARFASAMDAAGAFVAMPLVEPALGYEVGLVVPRRDPQPAVVTALLDIARQVYPPGARPVAACAAEA